MKKTKKDRVMCIFLIFNFKNIICIGRKSYFLETSSVPPNPSSISNIFLSILPLWCYQTIAKTDLMEEATLTNVLSNY